MAKFFSEIADNIILSEIVKDGSYWISLDEIRNPKLNAKYWKLIDFVMKNLPENAEYGVTWFGVEIFKVEIPNKNILHGFFKQLYGVESTSFSDMDETTFRDYYSKVLDICCKLLGTAEETVIKELANFF